MGTSSYRYNWAAADKIVELIVERLSPLSRDAFIKLAKVISDLGSNPLRAAYSRYCFEYVLYEAFVF
jgi:hypothetical protein